MLFSELNSQEPNTVLEINGDDFRAFHPEYYRFLTENDATAASKIDKDNRFFIESTIEASIERGSHVILEGTYRQPDVVKKTAELYGSAGYETRGVLMAVHPLLSRMGIFRRYLKQKELSPFARYTERSAHDAALGGLYDTTEILIHGGCFDVFTIVKRDGTVLFDALLTSLKKDTRYLLSQDALKILRDTHATLSREEYELACHELHRIDQACHTIPVPESIRDDLAQLHSDFHSYKLLDNE